MRARALLVPLLLLSTSALASNDLTFPTFGPTSYATANPLVATNGSSFLTLWPMNTARGPNQAGAGIHTYGSLAGANGQILTPVAFLIAPNRVPIGVFGAGHHYIALLREEWPSSKLQVAVISGDDHSVRLGWMVSVPLTSIESAAFNGDRFFVSGTGAFGRPTAVIVGSDGRLIGDPIFIGLIGLRSRRAMTADGPDFVVATGSGDGNAVYLQRFAFNGRIVTPPLPIAQVTGHPYSDPTVAIAANAGLVTVAWHRALDSTTRGTLGAAVVRPDGVVSVQQQTIEQPATRLTVVAAGGNSVLIVQYFIGATLTSFATRVDGSGRFLDPRLPLISVSSAAAIGDLVYAAGGTLDGDAIAATTLRDYGGFQVGNPVTLSVGLRRQAAPRAASDATDHFVTWSDERSDAKLQAVIRVSASGLRLDPEQTDLGASIEVRANDYGGARVSNSIAFGRSFYLVAWLEGSSAVVRRVSRGGVLDAQPIVLGPAVTVSDQAIAWDGTRFLVVWQSSDGIMSATINEQGFVAGTRKLFSSAFIAGDSRVIWDGARFVVTWMLFNYFPGPIHGYFPGGVGVVRISPDGSLLDSTHGSLMAKLEGPLLSWHLASSGREVLLVADRGRFPMFADASTFNTVAAVIHTGGPALKIDPPSTVFEWSELTASDVTWDRTSYVLSWRYGNEAAGWWIAMARSAAGEPPATMTAASAALTDVLAPPTISANGAGNVLLVVSEPPSRGDPARLRTYDAADMNPMVPAPLPPVSVTAAFDGRKTTIRWEPATSDATGYLIETAYPLSTPFNLGFVAATERSLVVPYRIDFVLVRALNAGGLSAPSATAQATIPRRRAAH